ncbi:hypothetical protein SARC_07367 [Sphaeroforma arctica JP610]|uniref:RING-type domain-containing protein n=1 Tax=Sphaeroforma arctica JP610 TaxID=667725 RepID=A0A0L0FWE3_9EUKA|nr:hypothetical protein SARC_07367 [Sphaeroforma arctica JP610]KNC80273.1 hypothetical protein SARC_07367 [Sphaeroforma arctica JP610]|eukprot:XP_014154175.1 hypothetical protein SARC_07367 [Sphaeroforma arctica JP610]
MSVNDQLNNDSRELSPGDTATNYEVQSCSICFDSISDDNSCFVDACCHNFCLSCILRWTKHIKQTCPLCQIEITHVLSYYQLDGSFGADLVRNCIHLMVQVRWLELDFECGAEDALEVRKLEDERINVEEDLYGVYQWDDYDEEFDMNNFAPGHGKSGRRRKSEAGCVSVEPFRGNNHRRRSDNWNKNKVAPAANSNAASVPPKLGRRAMRALQRKLADAAAV